MVVYLDWLGSEVSAKGLAQAACRYGRSSNGSTEKMLSDIILDGKDNLKGVSELEGVEIVGGLDNPRREGLVSLRVKGMVIRRSTGR